MGGGVDETTENEMVGACSQNEGNWLPITQALFGNAEKHMTFSRHKDK